MCDCRGPGLVSKAVEAQLASDNETAWQASPSDKTDALSQSSGTRSMRDSAAALVVSLRLVVDQK